jgi:hypothetical protein
LVKKRTISDIASAFWSDLGGTSKYDVSRAEWLYVIGAYIFFCYPASKILDVNTLSQWGFLVSVTAAFMTHCLLALIMILIYDDADVFFHVGRPN